MLANRSILLPILMSIVCGLALRAELARGQDAPLEGAGTPLKFRMLFIPQDTLDQWKRNQRQPILPMDRAEFEQLVKSLQFDDRSHPAARITSTNLKAKLVDGEFLEGNAALEIIHVAEKTVAMPFEPLNLAITGAPAWEDPESLDATIAAQPDGTLVVPVEKSSTLLFPWALRPKDSDDRRRVFEFHLPASSVNRIELQLPTNMVPEAESGFAKKLPSQAAEELATWVVEWAGRSPFHLELVPIEDRNSRKPLVLLGERREYRCSSDLVAMSAEFKLDVYHQPLNEIRFHLDEPIEVLSALIGDREIAIETIKRDAGDGFDLVLLLPEPLMGVGRIVHLDALIPIVTSKPWTLPHLRPVGVVWQDSETTLSVHAPLTLRDLKTKDCKVSKVGVLPTPTRGESVQIQHFSPTARIEVNLAMSDDRIEVRSGSTVRLSPTGLAAELRTLLSATQGERYEVVMEIASPWIVGSVDATSQSGDQETDVLLDWNIQSRRSVKVLNIQLRDPISPTREVRIDVRAHRELPAPLQTLAAEQLMVGRCRAVRRLQNLVAIHDAPPLALNFEADSLLPVVNSESLSDADAALIDTDGTQQIFQMEVGRALPLSSVKQGQRQYSSVNEVQAIAASDSLTELFRIQCRPSSSRVDQVLVHVSRSRDEPIQWTLEGGTANDLTARKLPEDERLSDAINIGTGEVWEIRPRRPRDAPFTLIGTRSFSFEGTESISLAWLPRASQQTGLLEIRDEDAEGLAIEAGNLQRTAAFPLARDRYSATRATYRYDPTETTDVRLSRPSGQTAIALWVWRLGVTSYFGQHGVRHIATCELENNGERDLTVKLPADAALQAVEVDGHLVINYAIDPSGSIRVSLPDGERFPQVRLTYLVEQSLPQVHGEVSGKFPAFEVPVLDRRWHVRLPSGYASREDFRRPFDWKARLFGPFLSQAETSGEASHADVLDDTSIARILADARRFTQAADDSLQEAIDSGSESIRWTQLLARYNQSTLAPGENFSTLVVDPAGLALAGVSPDSNAPHLDDATTWSDIANRLGLLLVWHQGQLVLTSNRSVLAKDDSQLEWLDSKVAVREPLPDTKVPLTLAPLQAWLRNQTPVTVRAPQNPNLETTSEIGWKGVGFTVALSDEKPRDLQVIRPAFLNALGWGAIFIFAAIAWWIAASRPSRLLLIAACVGSAAMLVPDILVPIGSGAFLGVLVAAVLVFVRMPTVAKPDREWRPPVVISSSTTALVLAIAAAAYLATAVGHGQDKLDDSVKASVVHPVVVSVDEEGNPTDQLVYLPEDFKLAILRRADAGDVRSTDWFLHSATYEGVLSPSPAGDDLDVTVFKAVIELETHHPDQQVILPIGSKVFYLLSDAAKLDGQPVDLDWTPEEIGVGLKVKDAGLHTLEFTFDQSVIRDGRESGVELSIPRIARSRLKLRFPADAENIQIRSAQGPVTTEGQTMTAQLGPTDRLIVKWPVAEVPLIEMEERYWLAIGSRSVSLDGRFRISVPAGRQLQDLEFQIDPRLEMQIASDQPVSVSETSTNASFKTVSCRLVNVLSDGDVEFRTTFALPGASSIGALRIPWVISNAESHLVRHMAVSVSSSLAIQPPDPQIPRIASDAFLQAWGEDGEARQAPAFILSLPAQAPDWSLHAQPKAAQTSGLDHARISLREYGADIKYACNLTTATGFHCVHRLTIPPQLIVDDVYVAQDGSRSAIRWSRPKDDTIVIFAREKLTGDYALSVNGTLPYSGVKPRRKELALPEFDCGSAQITRHIVDIYRHENIAVNVVKVSGLQADESAPIGTFQEDAGRLVASYLADETDAEPPQLKLAVIPDQPQVTCRQLIEVSKSDGKWLAAVTSIFAIESGAIDEFYFELPSQVDSVGEILPAGQSQIVERSGQNRRVMVVRPDLPVQGEYTLRFLGTLADQSSKAPDFRCLNASSLQQFYVFPSELEAQRIQWNLRGFAPASLPPDFRLDSDSGDQSVYRVVFPKFDAEIEQFQRSAGVPQVRLAEINLACQSDGSHHGVASFDLEPEGQQSCVLRMPKSAKLIHVSVAGLSAVTQSMGPGLWKISLGADQLPQRVTVVFEGKRSRTVADSNHLRVFEAPQLLDIPVDHTIWNVVTESEDVALSDGGEAVTGLQSARLRYDALWNIISDAEDTIKEQPEEESEHWLRHWNQRLISARDQIDAWSRDARTPMVDPSSIEELDRQYQELTDRLGMTEASRQDRIVDGLRPMRGGSEEPSLVATADGFSGVLEIDFRQPARGYNSPRMIGAILAFGGLLMVYLLLTRGPLGELLIQWPFACGVLLGLAWWTFLSPPVLGLAIVAVFSLAALRGTWSTVALAK